MTKKPIQQKSVGHARKAAVTRRHPYASEPFRGLVDGIRELLENARRTSARAVKAIMTATYWEIGRRIVEYEQGDNARAEYGEALLEMLAHDLTKRIGQVFSYLNLNKFRQFYLASPQAEILSTLSIESLRAGGRLREKRDGVPQGSREATQFCRRCPQNWPFPKPPSAPWRPGPPTCARSSC